MNNAGRITQMDKRDSYQMCSGQSVVDLATAVKELVENAMDANATVIDIRLKEYGKTSIEVIDNGIGIKKEDYENVVKKHYTSKISQFKDLETVATYGFRGEALSSLCQLSLKLTIFTRTKDDSLGSILVFDKMGNLAAQSKAARPVGTTITIESLFKPLPVRCKDFHKNIKKHYAKLLRILQAYALIGKSVKLSCTNTLGTNVQRVLATQMNGTILDKISNVFGTKYSKTLIPVDFVLGDDAKVQGFVSKAGEGVGRADSDRQFLYVNERPVNSTKFVKGLNEIWRTYEMKHKPGCILNFSFGAGIVDVNVSPDKRETYIVNENDYLEQFKAGLDVLWKPSRGKFIVQSQISFTSSQSSQGTELTDSQSSVDYITQPSQPVRESAPKAKTIAASSSSLSRDSSHSTAIASGSKRSSISKTTTDSNEDSPAPKSSHIPPVSSSSTAKIKRSEVLKNPRSRTPNESSSASSTIIEEKGRSSRKPNESSSASSTIIQEKSRSVTPRASVQASQPNSANSPISICSSHDSPISKRVSRDSSHTKRRQSSVSLFHPSSSSPKRTRASEERVVVIPKTTHSLYPSSEHLLLRANANTEILAEAQKAVRGAMDTNVLECDMTMIRKLCDSGIREDSDKPPILNIPTGCSALSTNPFDPEHAAAEFERVLKKEQFKEMEIVGQFNLGFIITRFGDDLFIIDQHASDEKNTFEKLQKTTELHQQPLVCPQLLELTAVEEMTVLDRLDIFEKNGFRFDIDEKAEPTKKLYLKAIPFSKQTQFGATDVRELVSMLIDSPEKEMIRLPKLMAMYASRACRTSVMIGTALRHEDMVRIVHNLATLEQPWNCPHGRPTMRHLVSLRAMKKQCKDNL